MRAGCRAAGSVCLFRAQRATAPADWMPTACSFDAEIESGCLAVHSEDPPVAPPGPFPPQRLTPCLKFQIVESRRKKNKACLVVLDISNMLIFTIHNFNLLICNFYSINCRIFFKFNSPVTGFSFSF